MARSNEAPKKKMIATSALNRDVFDFFGKWKSGHTLSVLPKAKRSDPKTGTVAGANASWRA